MAKHPKRFLCNKWWEWTIEAIGDWNPQLRQELNSRVSLRTVAIAILLSIGLQL
jgi:hypothetical protein